MILFAILRRAAGNYGRWALVRKEEDSEAKWTQLFYAPDDVSVEDDLTNHDRQSSTIVDESIDYSAEEAQEDRRFGGWIRSIFTLSDEKFMQKCGVDAVQYLKFQRHLIVFMAIMCVFCVCIILPINFQGNKLFLYLSNNSAALVKSKHYCSSFRNSTRHRRGLWSHNNFKSQRH